MPMQTAQLLFSEIVVKIAFFLQDWTTLRLCLEVLHTAKALGPLEHLWRLHHDHKWHQSLLWPRLELSKTKLTVESFVHLEAIAKYYPQIAVNEASQVAWLQKHLDTTTTIAWTQPTKSIYPSVMSLCAPHHVTSLEKVNVHPGPFLAAFPFLQSLQVLKCTPEITQVVLEYAASSASLQYLDLRATQRRCTITTKLADDLQQWIASQPVRGFRMHHFSWETPALRAKTLSSVLAKPTLGRFQVEESCHTLFSLHASFDRWSRRLNLTFSPNDGRWTDINSHADTLNNILSVFRPLLATKCQSWMVQQASCPIAGTPTLLWQVLAPMVQASRVQEFILTNIKFTRDDAIQMADAIQEHPKLERLTLYSAITSLNDAKVILAASPPSLKNITISHTRGLSGKERQVLSTIAAQRGISLNETEPEDDD
ncbi:hypothetical protein AeRB84_017363 [Aphanomyces euteiches]|nr:hypothetical protein AeRB84_017363 [Aphanomyces euteiches]